MPRIKNRDPEKLVNELAKAKVAMFPELDIEFVKKIIREQLKVVQNLQETGLI